MENFKHKIYALLATFFGIGYIPYAPGTAASIVTTVLVFFTPNVSLAAYIAILMLMIVGGVLVASVHEGVLAVKDPSCIVIDEVVGMMITLIAVPREGHWFLIALVLFRFFDIVKPFPIRNLERQISGGWGIVLDDVLAGIFSWIVLQGIMKVLIILA